MSERKRNALNKHKDRLKHKKNQKRLEKENSFESKVKSKSILEIFSLFINPFYAKKFNRIGDQAVKFGDIVHQPPTITSFPKLRKKINNPNMLTIPENSNNKGITENDRTEVIKRYRLMKSQGKFNA